MIGLPERLCPFCGDPAPAWSIWFDYTGRARYVCQRHKGISEPTRNRLLLTGEKPPW